MEDMEIEDMDIEEMEDMDIEEMEDMEYMKMENEYPSNIQEYVATKIIKYLKARDVDMQKMQKQKELALETYIECANADKVISGCIMYIGTENQGYVGQRYMCEFCAKDICINCSETEKGVALCSKCYISYCISCKGKYMTSCSNCINMYCESEPCINMLTQQQCGKKLCHQCVNEAEK